MIRPLSFKRKPRPRLYRNCIRCEERFQPKGTSKEERLCEKCFYKARTGEVKLRKYIKLKRD